MLIRNGHTPFESRDAFIEEAVAQLLKEMAIGTQQRTLFVPEPEALALMPPKRSPGTTGPPDDAPRLAQELGIPPIDDPAMTALHPVPPGFSLPADGNVADEPLFGLHNRDYPSLWALHRLAQLTSDGPMPFSTFRDLATQEAGRFALALWPLEERRRPGEPRLTALFPRGVSLSRGTAGTYFAQAAIGSTHKDRRTGEMRLHGPFFVWRVATLDGGGPKARIAMTDFGYRLLEELDGITIATPHEPGHAVAFLRHLRAHAPGDFAAFAVLLEGARDGADRDELVDRYVERFDWEGRVPETNLQGYVGRAREWGLVTPGRGIYALTEFGAHAVRELL